MSINFPNLDGEVCNLRHAYATFSLLKDGIDIHTLARTMGNSLRLIDRHHSRLDDVLPWNFTPSR